MNAQDGHTGFFPPHGTYVAFSLDFENTFEALRCDMDDATISTLRRLWRRTYVGYVSHYYDYPTPGRKWTRLSITPLQSTRPKLIQEKNITEAMYLPVAPLEPGPPIPTFPKRISIRTNKPLPWPNPASPDGPDGTPRGLYHPTCMDVIVRIPKDTRDYQHAWKVETLYQPLEVFAPLDKTARKRMDPYEMLPDIPPTGVYRSPCDLMVSMESFWWSDDPKHAPPKPADVPPKDIYFRSLFPSSGRIRDVYEEFNTDEDELFTPAIRFTTELSEKDTLLDSTELHRDISRLERIFRRCREGPPIPRNYKPMKNPFFVPEEHAYPPMMCDDELEGLQEAESVYNPGESGVTVSLILRFIRWLRICCCG